MSKLPEATSGPTPPAEVLSRLSDPSLDDQNRRWRAGCPVFLEQYLDRLPALRDDPEALLDLIYNEIRLREEQGEQLNLDEYCGRFPELERELTLQFEVHRAMRAGEILDDPALMFDVPTPPLLSKPPLPAIEGYEVLGELGRGAMGIVYQARHVRLDRMVALKMILTGVHAGPKERARFATEAQAVARLQHPHIVQIHEFGEEQGRSFVCLEFVPGGNLAQRLEGKPLSPRQAAELAEALARAVHYAHEHHIVHRDLKPANVLLAPSDSQRGILLGEPGASAYVEPKIADFGLAKLVDREADGHGGSASTGIGVPVGTPPYMAPEQASRSRGGESEKDAGAGRATDVYALGAILYEMLTGRPPFLASSVYETLRQVVSLEPVSPRRLQPQVTRDLETICLACLRKDPNRRYASALGLADDLRRYLEGRPIVQRRPAYWEPALKWARRRPAAAAWVVFAALALIAGSVAALDYVHHRQAWAQQEAHDRYLRFIERRDEALFQGTLLAALRAAPGDEAASELRGAEAAARDALAIAGIDIERNAGRATIAHLTDQEQSEVATSCYELLLVLAQAMAQPRPGLQSDERQQRTEAALRVLDQAALLGPPTRAFHLRRGRLLKQLGDQDAAATERGRAEAIAPESARDFYHAGTYQYEEGDTNEAIRSFRSALRLQPNHFEAQCFLAICALNAAQPGEARVGFTACIGQRPRFAWTYLLRGFAAMQKEEFTDAEADFTTALDLDTSPTVRYGVLTNRGQLALRQGKLEQAEVDLKMAVGLLPNECPARLVLAQVHQRRQQFAEAAQELDTAARLRPHLALVQRARGQMYLDGHELDAAFRAFEKAVDLERAAGSTGGLADDHIGCGRVRQLQGRFADAVAAYDAALSVQPDHALAHYLRGESLLELDRAREADLAFSQSLRVRSAFGPALRARGQARVRLGDYAGAVDDYTRALQLERDASILTHRGWALFFTDAWKLAEHDFTEAIQIDSTPGDAHVGRGLARVMLGDYRRAVADAEVVLSRGKLDTPEMMHNVACIYALAVARVQSDKDARPAEPLEAVYRDRAIASLHKAASMLPADKRLAFWQEKMQPDPALDGIRRSDEFLRLDRQIRGELPQRESITK